MNSKFNVQDLLSGNIDEKYNDQVFWYASEVVVKNNQVNIYVKNENLVTFDEIDLDMKKISELKDKIQNDLNHMKDVLVSSGSFLFINEKLAVMQRDLNTKFDPGFWTTPAGRCDRTIVETGIKETIEEIEIRRENKILFPDIAKKFNITKKNIEFYATSFKNIKFPLKTYHISLYLDNMLIEECKVWMYFSKSVNTIELRIPIFAELSENDIILKGEYKTATGLKSIEELRHIKCVPALSNFINF